MAYTYTAETYSEASYEWDSWAYSISLLENDGYFSFKTYINAAIICGVAEEGIAESNNTIRFGFYIDGANYRVLELGEFKTSEVPTPANAVFKIRRIGGLFSYYVNEILVYESAAASFYHDLRLYASMFGYMDAVLDPQMVTEAGDANADNTLPALASRGETENRDSCSSVLPPLESSAEADDPCLASAFLPGLVSFADTEDRAFCGSSLPALTSGATQGEIVVEICSAANRMAPLVSSGFGEDSLSIISELPGILSGGLGTDVENGTDVSICVENTPALENELYLKLETYLLFDLPKFSIRRFGVSNILIAKPLFSIAGDLNGVQTGCSLVGELAYGLGGEAYCGAGLDGQLAAFSGEVRAFAEASGKISAELLVLSGEAFCGGSIDSDVLLSFGGEITAGVSANGNIEASMPGLSGWITVGTESFGQISGGLFELAGSADGTASATSQINVAAFWFDGLVIADIPEHGQISGQLAYFTGRLAGFSNELSLVAQMRLYGEAMASLEDPATPVSLVYRRP